MLVYMNNFVVRIEPVNRICAYKSTQSQATPLQYLAFCLLKEHLTSPYHSPRIKIKHGMVAFLAPSSLYSLPHPKSDYLEALVLSTL